MNTKIRVERLLAARLGIKLESYVRFESDRTTLKAEWAKRFNLSRKATFKEVIELIDEELESLGYRVPVRMRFGSFRTRSVA